MSVEDRVGRREFLRNDLRDPARGGSLISRRTRRATLRIYLVIQFPRPVAIITGRGAEPWRITAPSFCSVSPHRWFPSRSPSPPTTALLFFPRFLSFSPSTQLLLFLRLSSLLSPPLSFFYPHFVPLTCFFFFHCLALIRAFTLPFSLPSLLSFFLFFFFFFFYRLLRSLISWFSYNVFSFSLLQSLILSLSLVLFYSYIYYNLTDRSHSRCRWIE